MSMKTSQTKRSEEKGGVRKTDNKSDESCPKRAEEGEENGLSQVEGRSTK